MKIPSIKKIEKQAEKYVKENFRPDSFLTLKLEILEKEIAPLCKAWNDLRDKFCNGSPCICVSHPRHKEFHDKIEPLQKQIADINRAIYNASCRMKRDKMSELMIAKAAKIRYLESQ